MNKLKLIGCIGLFACNMQIFAQGIKDTIHLEAVSVFKSHVEYFHNGAKKEVIDTLILNNTPSSSLSEILLRNTPLLVRSYGHTGAASTISLRGGGASRTLLSWEGFPVNSITMGDMDISMIPSSGFNYVAVDHSASATNFGSGTFGGAIELKNNPTWNKVKSASLSLTQGSFGTYKSSLGVRLGNSKLQYSGSFFHSQSQGNFPYFDEIKNDTMIRQNAESKGFGSIQNVYVLLAKNVIFQAGLWYQIKESDLPPIMGATFQGVENQIDSCFKAFVNLKVLLNKGFFIYKSAYMNDYQKYVKDATFSKIDSKRFLQSASYRYFVSSLITSDLEFQFHTNNANVSNYGQDKQELSSAIIYAIQFKNKIFQSNISVRKEFNSQYSIPLVYNFGVQMPLRDKKILMRTNIGTKYRTPTFNDLYWAVWGNPHLQPEHGLSSEMGTQLTIFNKKHTSLYSDINCFYSVINDVILWNPQGAVWHPTNYAQYIMRGIELRLKHNYTNIKYTFINNLGFDYNASYFSKLYSSNTSNASIGQSFFYTPKFSINFSPQVIHNSWNWGLFTNYQSVRSYSLSKSFPSYLLIDFVVKKSVKTKNITAIYNFQIKNITNKQYQLIRSYPMPGRYFEFSIQFLLNN